MGVACLGACADSASEEGGAFATGDLGGDTDSADASSEEGSASADTGTSESSTDASTETGTDTDAESGTSESGDEESCAEIEEAASVEPIPTDIIFAIDTSESMEVEYASVQANLNLFSQQISASGVDAHVVLIAGPQMCIAAPLGSGSCPDDSNPEGGYLRVAQQVGSNDSLDLILATHQQWAEFMRPNAIKHVVAVSDDEAYTDTSAWDQSFRALGPAYEAYQFHAIVGLFDIGDILMCLQDPVCCALVADSGDSYKGLVELTGGLLGDLCEQEFAPIFDELSTVVVDSSPLPCEFAIPEPETLDLNLDEVNVELGFGGGTLTIPRVDDPADCADVGQGWHYDEGIPPETITLCPQSCAAVSADPAASIAVKFGCATFIP